MVQLADMSDMMKKNSSSPLKNLCLKDDMFPLHHWRYWLSFHENPSTVSFFPSTAKPFNPRIANRADQFNYLHYLIRSRAPKSSVFLLCEKTISAQEPLVLSNNTARQTSDFALTSRTYTHTPACNNQLWSCVSFSLFFSVGPVSFSSPFFAGPVSFPLPFFAGPPSSSWPISEHYASLPARLRHTIQSMLAARRRIHSRRSIRFIYLPPLSPK